MRSDDLDHEVEARTRLMLAEQVRAHPERTLGELFEFISHGQVGRKLGQLTIGELLDDSRSEARLGNPHLEFREQELDLRQRLDMPSIPDKPNRTLSTAEQREEFDAMVLRLVEMFGPNTAHEISRIVCEPLAVSAAALSRLSDRGVVTVLRHQPQLTYEARTPDLQKPDTIDASTLPDKPFRSLETPEDRQNFDGMVFRILRMFGPANAAEISRFVAEPLSVSSASLARLVERGDAAMLDETTYEICQGLVPRR